MSNGIRLVVRAVAEIVVFVSVVLGFAWFMVNVFPQDRDTEVLQAIVRELREIRLTLMSGPWPWIVGIAWTLAVGFVFYVIGMLHVSHVCMTHERTIYRRIIINLVRENKLLIHQRDGYSHVAHIRAAVAVQRGAIESPEIDIGEVHNG
jgi:hypothetical protein